MAITNYSQLVAALERYSQSDDLKERIPDFIRQAELDLFRKLEAVEEDTSENLTTSTSDRFVALPTGYIKLRRLKIDTSGNGDYCDLTNVPLDMLKIWNSAGMPTMYAITDQIELNRTSDQAYTLQMQFIKEPTALDSTNNTNAILTAHPDLYLYSSLWQLFLFTEEDDNAAKWQAQYINALGSANRAARRKRYPKPAKYVNGSTP